MKKPIFLLFIFLSSCISENDVDITKYPMVTTASELAQYYELNLELSGNREETSVNKYIDGSFDLEYTYDFTETDRYDPLYYSITITKERSIKDAKQTFSLTNGAISLVSNSFSSDTIEIDTLDLPGDENYYAISTYEGQKHGVLFSMRKGKIVYNLITSGIYTDDHSILLELILPEIENMEHFKRIK